MSGMINKMIRTIKSLSGKRGTVTAALAALPFITVIFCYELLPLLQLIGGSFVKDGKLSLDNYRRIFSTLLYQRSIINSLRISIISTAAGIAAAFVGAKCYYDVSAKVQGFFTMLLNMTSNFSGVPLAFAYMLMLGNTGFISLLAKRLDIAGLKDFNLYSGDGLVLIYIYFQIPLATMLLIPAFVILKKQWKEAAYLLEADGIHYWCLIGIPNLLPGILQTMSVLFANALAAYATAYALVMTNYALLPLQLSSKFTGDVQTDKGTGGALAAVLIALMLLCTGFGNAISKRSRGKRNI